MLRWVFVLFCGPLVWACGRIGFETTSTDTAILQTGDAATPTNPLVNEPGNSMGGSAATPPVPADPPLVLDASSPPAAPGVNDGGIVEDSLADSGARPSRVDAQILEPTCIMCDSFDQQNFMQWEPPSIPAGASIEFDTQNPVRGAAIRFSLDPAESGVRLRSNIVPALTEGMMYTRFFMYLPSGQQFGDYIVVYEWLSDTRAISFDATASEGFFQLNLKGIDISTKGRVPRDRWLCIVIETLIDPNGHSTLHVDGNEQLSVSGDTTLDTGIDHILLGPVTSPSQVGSVEVSIDEFVVSTDPLGCN